MSDERKPHPTPGVWRTRVWFRHWAEDWTYRAYLGQGGALQGVGYESEAAARRALALHYYQYFGMHSDHLLAKADIDWPARGIKGDKS
jgi:hypothetical protein